MSGVQERIREAVEAIQGWLADATKPGEAVVRQAIVLRLLHAAGFDIWNPAEVVPEETNGNGNRSDFLIRAGKGKFALELKGAGIPLKGKPYEQVVTYAAGEGTRWAMLTNGRVWVVLDRMHNPGGTFEDHEVLKLELNQEGHTFADDLAALLNAETWRVDAFADAVEGIKTRQQQRLDQARIRREKTAVVEKIRVKFKIPTFALAADAAIEMNALTEAERDVLLGVTVQKDAPSSPNTKAKWQPPTPILQPEQEARSSEHSAGPIHFTYKTLGAVAHSVYRPSEGTWTVKAGSTLVLETKGHATGVRQRRTQFLAEGRLVQQGDQLRYAVDVVYSSPSTAADDISGGSKNGWDVWKDSRGRLAQFHRPKSSKPQSP